MTTLLYYGFCPATSYHFGNDDMPSHAVCVFPLEGLSIDSIRETVRKGYCIPLVSQRFAGEPMNAPHLFLHSTFPPRPLSSAEFEAEMRKVEFCLATHRDTEKKTCSVLIQIDPQTAERLRHKSIEEHIIRVNPETGKREKHQVESSFSFLLSQIGTSPARFLVTMDDSSIALGGAESASAPNSFGSGHTHPAQAYLKHRVCMAWPSYDDYVTFLTIYAEGSGGFHIIGTVEGMYIITVGPYLLAQPREKILANIKKYEKQIIAEYHRDYPRCDISPAIDESKEADRASLSKKWRTKIADYLTKINRKKYFRVQFVFWEDVKDHQPVEVEFKGVENTCALDDRQLQHVARHPRQSKRVKRIRRSPKT